ncbi:hypothetical protein ACFRCI_44925 [Streptomyces sp. NPDC056638]|uniref:hypothetical protein n=1 Tax=Streptomyces sp. NPDC056638 TaxID=3345887 RepID=UPI00368ACC7C
MVRESEGVGRLQLPGYGCLVLIRTALVEPCGEERLRAAIMRRLPGVLRMLADTLGDARARGRTGDRVVVLVREPAQQAPEGPGPLETVRVRMVLQGVAVDVLVFAGAEESQARDAVLTAARSP